MAHHGLHRYVEQLVSQRPDKAVDILTSCCQENDHVYREVMTCLVEFSHGQTEPRSPLNRLNITLGPAPPVSPLSSHHFASPFSPERLPRRSPSFPTPCAPLSPPRTVSSVTSHSSNDGIASGEYILLLNPAGNVVEENLVRMRIAAIKHSVIREDIVYKRSLDGNLAGIDPPCRASITRSGGPHVLIEVTIKSSVELTWRRPKSESTHSTIFYIVPGTMLDTDVLLGYEDSGEGIFDHSTTIAPQPQRRQGYILGEYDYNIRPPAPTPPSQSFHLSSMMYDSSASATPMQQQSVHQHQERQHQPSFLNSLLARQQANNPVKADSRLSQDSPTATVLGSRSLPTEHLQSFHPSNMPTTSTSSSDRSTVTDRIRLYLSWDRTPLKMWLDMCASSETFFRTFQQSVEKRKGIFERADVTIFLKKDKSTPDNEAYPLSLAEDDLEADWEEALSWLKDSSGETSLSVYGRVQVGEG